MSRVMEQGFLPSPGGSLQLLSIHPILPFRSSFTTVTFTVGWFIAFPIVTAGKHSRAQLRIHYPNQRKMQDSSVSTVYRNVIDDVIARVKSDFVQEGVDE